jgi:thiol:disulfide interchange protein DsbD
VRRLLLLAGVYLAFLSGSANAAGPVFAVVATWKDTPPSPGGSAILEVEVTVQPGWHVNADRPLDPYLIPTRASLDLPSGWTATKPNYPPPKLARLSFSEDSLAVFEGRFSITILISVASGAGRPDALHGLVEAQACNNQLCLAPAEVPFTVALAAAATTAPANGGPAPATAPGTGTPERPSPATAQAAAGVPNGFGGAGLLLQLAIVFLAGLALNLTPCVYPLIPITVGFFAAQKPDSRRRAWLLASTYVLGMSATYSALGVLAALSGRLFGSAMQSPWVVGLIVCVLLAFAASMFGLWELRVPAWASRASGGRSGLAGALVMGLVVGLVAAPCIGPFVLGLLTYVGQRQNVWLGFVLFFALSLGLGFPYLLLGVFTGALDRLPNSGVWMTGVRQLFGVLLIALAGYFVRPLLPRPTGDLLFAALLVAGGLYLLLVARPGHEQPWVDRFMRLASAAVLLAGVLLIPPKGKTTGGEVIWEVYDEASVQRAISSRKPVVLDFYATWCLPCKELEERTFAQPEVAARLASFVRFKVDLTTSDPATEALRRRFEVAGVPTIAFFVGGREVSSARLTGFEDPAAFLRRLASVEENLQPGNGP